MIIIITLRITYVLSLDHWATVFTNWTTEIPQANIKFTAIWLKLMDAKEKAGH
jgi:hypothetical protein